MYREMKEFKSGRLDMMLLLNHIKQKPSRYSPRHLNYKHNPQTEDIFIAQ